MELLKVLRMPFQLASVLFVATTSLLLALVLSVGGASQVLAIFAIWLLLVWLTQFSFTLIDDAANGVEETSAATAEMLSPFGDPRCWVHPFVAVVAGATLFFNPAIPRWPVLAAGVVLFPASLGAIAISGRALDAVNPFAMANVVRGLGPFYVAALAWIGLCTGAGVLLTDSGLWSVARIAGLQLLLLLVYAFIVGAVYVRRVDLGFEPRVSPERVEARLDRERGQERQRMIDGLYRDVRVREAAHAVASANQWLAAAAPTELRNELQAILAAGESWTEPRGFSQLVRGVIPQLMGMRQVPLAFVAAEAGLRVLPSFAPATEADAITLIRYAQQTGRKRVAATLLANFLDSLNGTQGPGPELAALRQALQVNSPATG